MGMRRASRSHPFTNSVFLSSLSRSRTALSSVESNQVAAITTMPAKPIAITSSCAPWQPLSRLPCRELLSLVRSQGGVEVDVGPSPIGPQGVIGDGELVVGLRCPNRDCRYGRGSQVSSKQPIELRLDLG
jgi:hypothetical protein